MPDLEPADERPLGLSMGSWLRLAFLAIAGVAIVAAVLREKPAATPAAGPAGTAATAPSWNGRVNYILFAAGADRGKPGLDVTGVIDELAVAALPATADLVVIVSVSPDRPGRSYTLAKLDPPAPGAGPAQGVSQPLRFKEVAGAASATTALKLPGLRVERAGEMRFAVKCDGQVVAERVLVVAVRPGGKPVETAGAE